MDLRYGMNPHQQARVATDRHPLTVRNGTPSLINLLDALNAWQLVLDASIATAQVAAASFKHLSPAGAALAGPLDDTAVRAWGLGSATGGLTSAYARARDADPKSSFGDMIAVSEPVDLELAEFLAGVVADGIVAPGFETGSVEILARKKGGTFLVLEADRSFTPPPTETRSVFGMQFEQDRDIAPLTADLVPNLNAVGTRDALLGLAVLRHTQSNSVALVKDGATLGIGAGQQNRVDCVRLAGSKAAVWWSRRHPQIRDLPTVEGMSRQDRLNWQIRIAEGDLTTRQRDEFGRLFPGVAADVPRALIGLTGVTLASDGFLPFRDNVDHAARFGVTTVIEPGGSTRSNEVVEACAEYGMTLVRTGLRLFHH